MNRPDLEKVFETFIPIPIVEDHLNTWRGYIQTLKTKVSPLIKELKNQKTVEWFAFLVHGNKHIAEDFNGPSKLYVHLRLEVTKGMSNKELKETLPNYCIQTRKMEISDPPSLDKVDIGSLKNQSVEEGWKILGELSELVLEIIDSHDPNKPIPKQNFLQFMHYLNNSLMGKAIGLDI